MRLGTTSLTWMSPSFQHAEQGVWQYTLVDSMITVSTPLDVRQAIQVHGEGGELAHRRLRAVGGHGHEMAGGSHVDAPGVQV